MERPALRPLEPVPIEHQGERLIAFRDQSGLTPGVVMVRPAAYFLLTLFDGTRTKSEALTEFYMRTGSQLDEHTVDQLLEELERALILDGPRAREALNRILTRPMAHAGSAYPEDPEECGKFLDHILAQAPPPPAHGLPRAVMAPHIDLRRGAPSYAAAYHDLKRSLEDIDTVVILGISHAPSRQPYILTRKPFETPFGPLESVQPVDRDELYLDEYNHLGEHSIEFQTTLLAYLKPGLKIVPILCGSFHEAIVKRCSPLELPGVKPFLDELKQALTPATLILASVDLAHKGVRFGEPPLSPDALRRLEHEDRKTLAHAERGDYEAFFRTHVEDRGVRNYCGTSAIYAMLYLLEGKPGRLHRYDQCNEPGEVSTVTVAAASYYR